MAVATQMPKSKGDLGSPSIFFRNEIDIIFVFEIFLRLKWRVFLRSDHQSNLSLPNPNVVTNLIIYYICQSSWSTSPYRIIIQDMEPNVYHLTYGEDGCLSMEEDELQTRLDEFFTHHAV